MTLDDTAIADNNRPERPCRTCGGRIILQQMVMGESGRTYYLPIHHISPGGEERIFRYHEPSFNQLAMTAFMRGEDVFTTVAKQLSYTFHDDTFPWEDR